MKKDRWLLVLIFVITAGSFLLELWPLAAAGVVAMGFVGKGYFAPPLGLLLDLAYGAPLGAAAFLFFPFTILGLVVVVARYWAIRYFLNRGSQERL